MVPQPRTVKTDGVGREARWSGVQHTGVQKRKNIRRLIPDLSFMLRGIKADGTIKELREWLETFVHSVPAAAQQPQLDSTLLDLAKSITGKLEESNDTSTSETLAKKLKRLTKGLARHYETQMYQPMLQNAMTTVAAITGAQQQIHKDTMGILNSAVNLADNLTYAAKQNVSEAHSKAARAERERDLAQTELKATKEAIAKLRVEASTQGINDAAQHLASLQKDVAQANLRHAEETARASRLEQDLSDQKGEMKKLRDRNDFLSQQVEVLRGRCRSLTKVILYYGGYDPEVVRAVLGKPETFPEYIWGKNSGAFVFEQTPRGLMGRVAQPLPEHISVHRPSEYMLEHMASYYAMKERNPLYKHWAPLELLSFPYESDEEYPYDSSGEEPVPITHI